MVCCHRKIINDGVVWQDIFNNSRLWIVLFCWCYINKPMSIIGKYFKELHHIFYILYFFVNMLNNYILKYSSVYRELHHINNQRHHVCSTGGGMCPLNFFTVKYMVVEIIESIFKVAVLPTSLKRGFCLCLYSNLKSESCTQKLLTV